MTVMWHYSRNGESLGPVSEEELKSLIVQGKILATDLVWRDGMKDWVPLAKVKELNAASSGQFSFLSAVLGLALACVLAISSVVTWRFLGAKIAQHPDSIPEPQVTAEERAKAVEDARREIRECRWWSTPPTDREIDAIRDAIVGLGPAETLWVDDSAQFVSTPADVHEFPKEGLKQRAAGTRHLWIRVPGEQRKTSDKAVSLLRNAVMTALLAMKAVPEGAAANLGAHNSVPGWKVFSAKDLQGSQGLDVSESIINDHLQHGVTAVYTVAGRDFFTIGHDGQWCVISLEVLLDKGMETLGGTINGQVMKFGHLIRPNVWAKVEIVQVPTAQKLVCLIDGKIADSVSLGNAGNVLRMKVSSERPAHGTIEVRKLRVCTEQSAPAGLIAAATPPPVVMPVQPETPSQPKAEMQDPADALQPAVVAQALPDDPVPIEFQMYFERVEDYRLGLIKDLNQKISDLEITIRGAQAGQRKAAARVELSQAKEAMAELKRSKVYPRLPVPARIGDIGSLQGTKITAVLDNRSAIARYGTGCYYHLTDVDAKPLKSGQVVDVTDLWQVVEIGAASEDVRRRSSDEVAILKPVKKGELERFRAMYAERKTPKPRPKDSDVPAVIGEISAEHADYFARADENHKGLMKATAGKIAELEAAIEHVDTLPVDKATFRQELILARAKLVTLKNAKPAASLTSRPQLGDLGTLPSALIIARHDDESVIAAVPNGPAYRLTEIEPKSLKMRPKVPVDDDEVWQVVALDEKPTDTVADLIKADTLIVLRPIKKADLDSSRIAYEAEKKASAVP